MVLQFSADAAVTLTVSGLALIGRIAKPGFFRYENVSVLRRKPGVDVAITIFCDFRQFSAIFDNFLRKKLALNSSTNVVIKFSPSFALL
jgi:hypothetical protein